MIDARSNLHVKTGAHCLRVLLEHAEQKATEVKSTRSGRCARNWSEGVTQMAHGHDILSLALSLP